MNKLLSFGLGVVAMGVSVAGAFAEIDHSIVAKAKAAPERVAALQLKGMTETPRVLRSERAAIGTTVPAEYVGRKMYGSVVYSDYITMGTYGLYEFTITNQTIDHTPKVTDMSMDWMAGARLRDRFYGIRAISLFGKLTDAGYEEVDIVNNKILRTEFRGEGSYAAIAATMAPDFTDSKIYGIMYNEDLTGLNLAVLDPEALEFKVTGKFGGRFNPLTLAAAPNGKLYTVSGDGDLYTVDKKTGRVSLVEYTGVNVAAYNQSMTWDSKTNRFLWAAMTPTGSKLYALNPETAQATFIMNIPDNTQITGLYLANDEQAPAAPAKVADLAFNWSSQGSNTGAVSFTVPAVDGSGAAITDNVSVSVWIDGEVQKNGEKLAPGSAVTIPVDLSTAMHQVAVSVKGANGYAPVATMYEWAGFDCPKAVSNLRFAVDGREATVTWDASTQSEHGGYMDPAKVVYNVWRLPENVLVAENLSAPTFSETLPEAVQQYSYRVVPVNTQVSTIPGKAAVSNVLVAGEAYTVPYSENWKEEGSEKLFGSIDGDGDGTSWNWFSWNRNWNFTNPYQGKGKCNDWFITPLIRLEKDKVYRFVSNLRNSFVTGPEYLDLAYGTSATDTASYTKFGNWVLANGEDTDREYAFEVPETGRYHMALVNVTEKTKGSSVLMNSLGVELIGSAFAPAAATEFSITPDSTRARQATLKFVAPTTDMRGTALSGTLTAKIYRDGNTDQAVHTIENVAVGAPCEWLDNTVEAAGVHKYKVVFENAFGEGMPASGSAFIGIYSAPYFEACATKSALKEFSLEVSGFTYDAPYPPLALSYDTSNPAFELTHFNQTESSHDLYVYLPDLFLEDESVYKLNLDFKNSGYGNDTCVYQMRMGSEPTMDMQTEVIGSLPLNTAYQFANQEFTIVNTKVAKKNISMFVSSRRKNDYTNIAFRNISLVYEGSALAPDSVVDLRCASAASAVISFTAPVSDYAGRTLGNLTGIEVYRNGQAIAAMTFTDVTPGQKITWTDENAILGKNKYMIVPVNDYGRGRPAYVDAFIGFDVPTAPASVGITPSDNNQTARIDWTRVKRGVNGGVLSDDLTYKVVQMVQVEDTVEYRTIKEGLTGTSYTLDRKPTDTQFMEFYGVVAVTPQGESTPGLYYTILGKPYELPFAESFPKGEAKTEPWIGMHAAGALQSGPTASEGMATMNTFPQDGDGGSFFFLNGTMMDFELTIPVLTPKVTFANVETAEVRFWLYKGNHSGIYAANPMFGIFSSYNEGEFELLGATEWNESKPEWKEYVYNLNHYAGKPGNVIFQLVCRANGYQDFVVMDNFRVQEVGYNSLDQLDADDISVFGLQNYILTRGAAGKNVEVYTLDGRLIDSFIGTDVAREMPTGIYLVRIAGHSYKVAVK